MLHRVRVPLSIDTTKAEVARFGLDEGVSLLNDISGLQYDLGVGDIAAVRGAPLVLMHMRGRPVDMYAHAHYDQVAVDVARDLTRAVERAVSRGVPWDQLVVDPGLGFAKRAEHSAAALAGVATLAALGRPVLVGPSRKSFLAAAAGGAPAAGRDWPTAAAVTAAVLAGAHIVRVHAVAGDGAGGACRGYDSGARRRNQGGRRGEFVVMSTANQPLAPPFDRLRAA